MINNKPIERRHKMTFKEKIYKELCEMGKLGMNINYPKCFKTLENIKENEFQAINVSNATDLVIQLSY